MHIAVIPLVVWLIVAAFGGGAIIGGGTVAVVMWKDRPTMPIVEKLDPDGNIQSPGDPMTCVDLYYKSVMDVNYKQYQFCVMEPDDSSTFERKSKGRVDSMKKRGLVRVEEPVRGRTEFKEIRGTRGAVVFSVSPWSGKEEKYDVVSQGQGWKIVREK